MRPDLEDRYWPLPLSLQLRRERSSGKRRMLPGSAGPLVDEGYVLAKELALRGSTRPIPHGECAITSLATDGKLIYGATSGRRAHVFAYWPQPAQEAVLDMVALDGHTSIRHSLACLGRGSVYAGTAAPQRDQYPGGEILKIRSPGGIGVIQEWNVPKCEPQSLGIPVPGEGVACLIADTIRDRLYGMSDRSGTVFSVAAGSGKIESHGTVDEIGRFSPELILGPDHRVYACRTAGCIVRFDPDSGAMEQTDLRLPAMAGRGQYSQVGAWVADPRSGRIYAGDVADGLLSVLDVRTGQVRVLGKPTGQPHIRALAVAADGRVYGMAGLPGRICHLFCHRPDTGEMRDLGVLTAAVDRRWYGYEFDCALAADDGRVYFGESDRISHLFAYFPPALAPQGADDEKAAKTADSP